MYFTKQIDSELHEGDLVSISFGYGGFLNYDRNNSDAQRLCEYDPLQVLWLFIDLGGNIDELFMIAG